MKIKGFWGSQEAISESCSICGLHSYCKNPFTKVYGKGKLNVLIVTDKPSSIEDAREIGFSGETIESLKSYFSEIGINIEQNFYKTSAIGCYTEKTKEDQIVKCRKRVRGHIAQIKPTHIITIGETATKSLIGDMMDNKPPIETLCFRKIPIFDYNAWVLPMMNPAKCNTPNNQSYFRRLTKWVMQEIKKNEKMVEVDPFEKVQCLSTYDDIMDGLEELLEEKDFISAADTEGTGLKPQYEKHRITSIGIATRKRTIAFPIDHKEAVFTDQEYWDIVDALKEYLERKDIKKIAHNEQFDMMWFEVIFGIKVDGFIQCTLTNQHLQDHRKRAKGLKDLAFLLWGIKDYNARAKPFIAADRKGAKELNRMWEMPLHEQLLYVGADASLTLHLSDEQDVRYELDDNPKKAFPRVLFHEGNRTLCTVQQNGIPIDIDYYKNNDEKLTKEILELEQDIWNYPEVAQFRRTFRKEFEHAKPKDLERLLFDVCNFDPKRAGTTEKGNISLDEKALKEYIDFGVVENILFLRKKLKIRDTFLAGFIREEVNGRIHPFFRLTVPRSYRSSSTDPNGQNTPKRDPEAKKITRGGWVPDKGCGLGEQDFSGVEVCTSAAYHQDPIFIRDISVDGADMHRDFTCDIWQIPPELIDPKSLLRFFIKNCWTFPQFYGDYYGSCGTILWETVIEKEKIKLIDGTPVEEHMHDKKIHNVKDFTEHCRGVEDRMWNERFKVFTQWKKDINDFYIKYGYVETFMGFRFTGCLDKKQTGNYPIQGTAFHILLWCLNRIQEFIEREHLRSYICGQIHDSIFFNWYPDERDYLLNTMTQICTVDVRNEFPWINVPFKVDVELTKIDGNFAELFKFKQVGNTWEEKK